MSEATIKVLAKSMATRLVMGEATLSDIVSQIEGFKWQSDSALFALEVASHIPDSLELKLRQSLGCDEIGF